jgi:hypothetical protein
MEKYNKNIQIFSCKDCDYTTSKLQNYNTHLLTLKHKNNTLAIVGNEKVSSNESNYICCNCNYNTNKKCNYDKHLLTEKHKKKSNEESTEKKYTCAQCNKDYLNYNALWKHKKHCVINDVREPEPLENTFTPQLIMEVFNQSKGLQEFLVEQNRELQNKLLEKETELQNKLLEKENQLLVQNEEHHKQIIELASRQISNTNNTNINTQNNNNQFNLQFFLNETCKDAMNIVDFVNSLQVQIADLEKTGKLGYVEGISSIFLKGLKQLDISMRPIHCTDLKRETVYVKDEDNWNKEDEEKAKMKLAIQRIARKNLRTLPKWQQENPDFRILDTNENNDYLKIALNSLGGQTEEEQEKYIKKIIKNVMKEVIIEKK